MDGLESVKRLRLLATRPLKVGDSQPELLVNFEKTGKALRFFVYKYPIANVIVYYCILLYRIIMDVCIII